MPQVPPHGHTWASGKADEIGLDLLTLALISLFPEAPATINGRDSLSEYYIYNIDEFGCVMDDIV